jgi:hypothetical protein
VSESFLLSLIFLGIIALIGFIGASFGIARGFAATASILGGAEFGLWWGGRIGSRLSDWLNMTDETGRFLGAMFCLLVCVVLVGVAGSLVLSWGSPTRWGTMLGILLGAANGALLIAMALRLYFLSYGGSLSNSALNDSIVTRALWTNYDWFILGFVVVAAIALLYTRLAGLAVAIPEPAVRAPVMRPIPPPVPRSEAGLGPARGVRPVPPPVAGTFSANGTATHADGTPADDAIYAPPRPVSEPPASAVIERTTVVEMQKTRAELPSARHTVRFCPNCGMTLDASDRFCPDCGFTL